MSNHFHLLIEEPDQEVVEDLDAESIFKLIGFLYDSVTVRPVREEWQHAKNRREEALCPDSKVFDLK